MKRLSFVQLLLLVTTLTYSQPPKTTNTLLWRITGKGLTKPSYLYGTMHLTDKKIFFLGDSVYRSIESTEGFASELDLNSMGMQMINQLMKEEQEKQSREPVKLKDVVTPETWQRYKTILSEKFGKKAESITVDDLDKLQSNLENEMFRKGDMPTFLDAYLFGLAKKKGKWVGGIEDIEDQLEHITSDERIENKIQVALYDENYYRKSIAWMMKIYNNQQLDSIDAMMYREESGLKDYILIKRNIKMARRMDSLSAIRSTFFAVGVAHLPGDSGVIAMLRTRGFEVTPVLSSKKLDPSKYVVKSSSETWLPVELPDNAYTLSMPGVADKFEMLEEYGLHTKMFFDLSFMKMYMTMNIEIGEERKKLGVDSLFTSIKKQYAKSSNTIKEKVVTVNGEEGRELTFATAEGYFVMQIFFPKLERLVLNAVMTLKEASTPDEDSKKFFESFVVNKDIKPTIQNNEWKSYQNSIEAFSIDFPMKPIEKKDVRSEEGKILHNLQAFDMKSQVVYGISVTSIKEGMFWVNDDSSHYKAVVGGLRSVFKEASIVDSSFFDHSGFQSYKFTMKAKSEGEDMVMQIFSILRGNRNYYLYTVYQPAIAGQQPSEVFFNSFKFLPINYSKWTTHAAPDNSFETVSPFPFKPLLKSDEETIGKKNKTTRFMMYDTLVSHSMFVDRSYIPKWYWYKSDSDFLYNRAKNFVDWDDTMTNYKTSVNGKTRQAEFVLMKRGSSILKKVKIIISGNEMYDVYGYLAKQDLEDHYQQFFDRFTIKTETIPLDINQPKYKELEETIRKGNKEDIEEVKEWWDGITFSEKELPLLQSLMMVAYPDLDSAYYNTLNWKIIEQVKKLDSNHVTIDLIKAKYQAIEPEDDKVKALLVNYLCGISTKESYDLAKEILANKNYPPEVEIYPNLYDSLQLSATLYPEIFILEKNKNLRSWIYGVATTLVDSNLLAKKMLLDHEKEFIDQATTVLKEKTKDEEVYGYYELVKILGILNTPTSAKLLAQFAKYSDRQMKFVTLVAMLKNNMTVDQRNIYTLATTDEYRYDLYEELRKLKKLVLFPKDYLSQEKIGRSRLYSSVQEEDYVLSIRLVGEKTITYKGKKQKVYLYKVYESEEDVDMGAGDDTPYYLAVSGPFSIDTKDCYSTHELTGVYWDEDFDESKIDELLKKYIASIEEAGEN